MMLLFLIALVALIPAHALAECGIASTYGAKYHGRKTASGEPFDMHAMTAAHRTLPFGSTVVVTDRRTGKTVQVRINDRGPFIEGRVIDLSMGAQRALGASGLALVCLKGIN